MIFSENKYDDTLFVDLALIIMGLLKIYEN